MNALAFDVMVMTMPRPFYHFVLKNWSGFKVKGGMA
jgi:hypothetical protein